MKTPRLIFIATAVFTFLIFVFSGCKKDVSHPSSTTKTVSNPVPDGYTMTSVGLIPNANITVIEPGYKLSFIDGHAFKVHAATGNRIKDLGAVMPNMINQSTAPGLVPPHLQPPGSSRANSLPGFSGQSDNWITYSQWQNTNGKPITNFISNLTVPSAPTGNTGQIFAIWEGLEPTSTTYPLVQPLLIWGNSGGSIGGGQYWTIVSYVIWLNSSNQLVAAISSVIHNVAPGTALQSEISCTGQQPDGSYNCVAQFIGRTSLSITENVSMTKNGGGTVLAPFIPALNYACEVLEIPGAPYITAINQYPNQQDVRNTSIGITTGFGSNATNPTVAWQSSSANGLANGATLGEHTDIISPAEVDLYFQPEHPVISYPSPDVFYVGTHYSISPTNTGSPVIAGGYSSPVLPPGFTIDPNTGIISGTPTSPVAAWNYTVTAVGTGGSGSCLVNITTALPGVSFGISNNSANGLSITFYRTDQSQSNISTVANAHSGTNPPVSIPAGTYTISWNPSGQPANCVVRLSNGQASANTPGGSFTGVVIGSSGVTWLTAN